MITNVDEMEKKNFNKNPKISIMQGHLEKLVPAIRQIVPARRQYVPAPVCLSLSMEVCPCMMLFVPAVLLTP